EVVLRTTSSRPEPIEPLFTGEDVLRFQSTVREVPVATEIAEYAVRLSQATRPGREEAPDFVNQWVGWGAGTRASQTLVLCAKARALMQGRSHVQTEDIVALAHASLRHRVLPTYRAEAEGITIEQIIDRLLETVPRP
ncbi:MAG: AAA family ATPase, partial [Planctomycetota bacterium]